MGYLAELDTLLELSTSGKDYLLKLELRERERTGINSLKVRYNKVFGYYLEVTKANLHHVPREWIRKQTTAGGERYVTEELKTYEEKVLTADEKRIALEQRLFEELRALVVARASACCAPPPTRWPPSTRWCRSRGCRPRTATCARWSTSRACSSSPPAATRWSRRRWAATRFVPNDVRGRSRRGPGADHHRAQHGR